MARKDQLSSNKDRCDICGAALDDDSLVQEFPDGSVVAICADCAAEAAPEDELEDREYLEPDDATAEWAGPHDDSPTAPAPPHFEAEVFAFDEPEPQQPPAMHEPRASQPALDYESPQNDSTNAEAELAAWASASSEHNGIREDDPDTGSDYDQEDLEEATLQLVAAIAEADMEDDERTHPDAVYEQPEASADEVAETVEVVAAGRPATEPSESAEPVMEPAAQPAVATAGQPATEPETPKQESIDRTQDLLMPVTDLVALQNEMQSALAKLSSTLEHFISDMAASEEKSFVVNDRVLELEDELESTRERLRKAQSLLPDSAVGAAAAMAAATATRDAQLLDGKPDSKAETGAAVVPPPVPPPLPGSQATPPPIPPLPTKAASKDSTGTATPPPLGLGTAAGAAGAALGAAAGAMVPPPLPGLAAAAKAVAGAAITPPSLGGAKAPKASAPPPLPPTAAPAKPASPASPVGRPAESPATSKGVPQMHIFKSSGDEVEIDDEAGSDATSVDELLIAPVSPPPLTPTARTGARPPSRPADSLPPGPAKSSTSGPEAGSSPAPTLDEAADSAETPAPSPVTGAAAAMQKLLRGRKGQAELEPEPEPKPEPEPQEIPGLGFTIKEVQVAQRYFNESEFVKKLSEISRSIGRSQANLSRSNPGEPEAAITVFWDIVWYQYLVDLRKDLPEGTKRVVLAQEGMDFEELEPRFREKNAAVDDNGRLDASELEIRLLSESDELITDDEVSTPETRLADDATEEIWDQRSAPEFRWD